jgi:hypothetical protein
MILFTTECLVAPISQRFSSFVTSPTIAQLPATASALQDVSKCFHNLNLRVFCHPFFINISKRFTRSYREYSFRLEPAERNSGATFIWVALSQEHKPE